MISKIINIFWGTVLIIVSGLLLADKFGLISLSPLTSRVWVIVFGIASAMFCLTYFLSGVRKWGWLFPALICAVMAWHSPHIYRPSDLIRFDWPMWTALAIPFYVGFATDRKRWILLIPAYVLSVVAFMVFSDAVFLNIYRATNASQTFLLALLAGINPLFLFAIPFYAVYFWSKKNWWTLLPAGGLTSIVVCTVLSILITDGKNAMAGVPPAALLLGFALTLGILWLRRGTQPTGWAKVPAIGFLALAIAALLLGRDWADLSQNFGLMIFIAGSAIFFIAYFLHGIRKWGWLFPAIGCAAMAVTIRLDQINAEGPFTDVPLFAGLALPFFASFAVTRKRGLLIPGTFLAAFAIFLPVSELAHGNWPGVIFFGLFALASFVTYFLSNRPWWMLLPAGGFTSFGLTVLIDILVPHQEYLTRPNILSWDVFIWVLFLCLAATFGAVWLYRKTEPTDWAKYPATCLLVIGLLALLLGKHFQEFWLPTMTLVIGVTFLLTVITRLKQKADQSVPRIEG